MSILLLSGWAGSGKDAVGDILCSKYGFIRIAVADAMKNEMNKVFGIPYDLMNTQEGKSSKVTIDGKETTIREIIINYAMGKRSINPDYWIDCMLKDLETIEFDKLVITDFRFINEYEKTTQMFPDFKVHSIRINRLRSPLVKSTQSENVLDDYKFDAVIDNTKDIPHLHEEVSRVLLELGI